MLAIERRDLILRWVKERGNISNAELLDRLEISKMTLWRDLKVLEEEQKIERVHGGAASVETPERNDEPVHRRQILRLAEKESIARYAARNFVSDREIVALEGGTTVTQMVQFLTQNELTVVSYGLNTLVAASKHIPRITVMGCGGLLREPTFTFVGPEAEGFFHDITVDLAFISGEGLTADAGITDPDPLEIQIKRAMCASASRVVAVMNSYKLGKRSLALVVPLKDIDVLVTDSGVSPEFVRQAEGMGVEVHVVA